MRTQIEGQEAKEKAKDFISGLSQTTPMQGLLKPVYVARETGENNGIVARVGWRQDANLLTNLLTKWLHYISVEEEGSQAVARRSKC